MRFKTLIVVTFILIFENGFSQDAQVLFDLQNQVDIYRNTPDIFKNISTASRDVYRYGKRMYDRRDMETAVPLFRKAAELDTDNGFAWFYLACSLAMQHQEHNSDVNSAVYKEITKALKKATAIHTHWQLQIFTEPALEYVREYPFDSKNEADYVSPADVIVFSKDGFIYRVHHSSVSHPQEYEYDLPEDSLVDHDTSDPVYIDETAVFHDIDEAVITYELLGFYTIIDSQIFMYSIEDGYNSHFEWFPGAM